LLRTRNFDAAIQEYEQAIHRQPTEPITHYNLAVALEATGQKARARQEYEAYLQLSPAAPDAGEVRKHLRDLPPAKK
jgi:Flp pilus assembly protein TadD